jgi:hypothetical protein
LKGLANVREWVWPILNPFTPSEEADFADRLQADRKKLARMSLGTDSDAILEEARRLADSEAERRKSTDQKASTYLAVVAALVPLIVTVTTTIWDKKAGSAPPWLNMLLLGSAVAYTAVAGIWAFRVLKVAPAHRLAVGELASASGRKSPARILVKQLLLCTRLNQAGVNEKVSRIKMAHEFLLRAFATFALLLAVNIIWYFGDLLWKEVRPATDPWFATPQSAVAAVVESDRLGHMLASRPVWEVLDERCRAQTRGRETAKLVSSSVAEVMSVPPIIDRYLRPDKGSRVIRRDFQIQCARSALANLRVWYLPARANALGRAENFLPFRVPGTIVVTGPLMRVWPPTEAMLQEVAFPSILMRQYSTIRNAKGRSVAVVAADVKPTALGSPNS